MVGETASLAHLAAGADIGLGDILPGEGVLCLTLEHFGVLYVRTGAGREGRTENIFLAKVHRSVGLELRLVTADLEANGAGVIGSIATSCVSGVFRVPQQDAFVIGFDHHSHPGKGG